MYVKWEWLAEHDWVEYRDFEAFEIEDAFQDGLSSLLILNKCVFQRKISTLNTFTSNRDTFAVFRSQESHQIDNFANRAHSLRNSWPERSAYEVIFDRGLTEIHSQKNLRTGILRPVRRVQLEDLRGIQKRNKANAPPVEVITILSSDDEEEEYSEKAKEHNSSPCIEVVSSKRNNNFVPTTISPLREAACASVWEYYHPLQKTWTLFEEALSKAIEEQSKLSLIEDGPNDGPVLANNYQFNFSTMRMRHPTNEAESTIIRRTPAFLPIPKSPGRSLAALAEDFFVQLTQDLDGNDFIALMMSGNRLLRYKLRNTCSSLFFDSPSIPFPFAALKLPKLRSLAIHSIKEATSYLDFRTSDPSAFTQGHKTLQTLVLDVRNAMSLFLSSDSQFPRSSIQNRFPSLSTLFMSDLGSSWSSSSLFGELPETLSTLSVTAVLNTKNSVYIGLESISKLPKHLTSLKLEGFKLADPDGNDFKFFERNRKLQSLVLDKLAKPTILNHLPPVLKYLRVSARKTMSHFTWKSSKIPRGLINLDVKMPGLNINLDVPLPTKLEFLEISADYSRVSSELKVDNMPKTLKSVGPCLIAHWLGADPIHPRMDRSKLFDRFPNIEKVAVHDEDAMFDLPTGLKNLLFAVPLPVLIPLPSTLITLSICFPMPMDCFANLPTSLQSLNVSREHNPPAERNFPPWNLADMVELVSKLRLESFSIEMESLESTMCLAPLSRMETLKVFTLHSIELDAMYESPKWLPNCLPRSLKELSLFYCRPTPTRKRVGRRDFSYDDFLRLCDLASVTPHLRSLTMRSYYLSSVEFGHSFAYLPRGLLLLDLHFSTIYLSTEAFSMLPRSLKRLHIVNINQSVAKLSKTHLQLLPESLQDLKLTGIDPFEVSTLEVLPKSIVTLHTDFKMDSKAQEQLQVATGELVMSNRALFRI